MKIVRIQPFGVFKVGDDVLETVNQNSRAPEKRTIDEVIRSIKKNGTGEFVGIDTNKKEMFKFIPIIEDGQFFAAQFPEPVQLYFSLAYSNFQYSKKSRETIVFQKDQGSSVNFVSSYLYNWHLKYKISTIIFLHSTVEAFLNYLMPEDFIYLQESQGNTSSKYLNKTIRYNKKQTERFILFKEKLDNVVTQLFDIRLKQDHQKIYDDLVAINKLRNDLIHLRSIKDKNQLYFEQVFDKVLNTPLDPFVDAVKDFINLLKPEFLVFEDEPESNSGRAHFKFENYTAFGTDVSIFLKILAVPKKIVVLTIPKSEDPKFQYMLNWAMKNFEVMAKEQLIQLVTISDSEANLIIEITKTDKRIGGSE
ncbi:MAG: hypothetical protein U0T75_13810 [Chitinophagales bacterium]